MKQIMIVNGTPVVEDVPEPQLEPGSVLVRVQRSCISPGTEGIGVTTVKEPLWKRALKNPDKVRKALQMIATDGFSRTRSVVEGKLLSGNPTGYSASGAVIGVGDGIEDVKIGDAVACAGAQCAHHAEVIRVPRNLTARVPSGLDAGAASTVALGSIALQGIRRAQPTLGEVFIVIGLGVLGQITAQLLRANGCTVIGTDLDESRTATALELGMEMSLDPDGEDSITDALRLTEGVGADGVIITASTPSDAVASLAFQMCRRKGRVVLVGDVGLSLRREDFYAHEIDFLISTSYGPGRYDRSYEEDGMDYPPAYVRWTENRNMGEYLKLLASGKVNVAPLITKVFPVGDALDAYKAIKSVSDRPMITLLSYPERDNEKDSWATVVNPHAMPSSKGVIRVALAGAGGFAKGMHLPNIKSLADDYHLQAVVSRSGHNASATARQFNAEYSTTDYKKVLDDPNVDAVLICTRHDLHASMTLDALEAGKHVLVEKPLALTRDEFARVVDFYKDANDSDAPILLTGYNRRFSKYARRVSSIIAQRKNPIVLNYRMNAGYIPPDSWIQSREGGGRNLGEACHIYDLFIYLTGAAPTSVAAHSISTSPGYYSGRDNFTATIEFDDGSIATLTYVAMGSKDYPKEQLEVFCDGKVITLNDYKELSVAGSKAKGIESSIIDKGHREELEEFARAVRKGGDWPISLTQQIHASQIAFDVEEQL